MSTNQATQGSVNQEKVLAFLSEVGNGYEKIMEGLNEELQKRVIDQIAAGWFAQNAITFVDTAIIQNFTTLTTTIKNGLQTLMDDYSKIAGEVVTYFGNQYDVSVPQLQDYPVSLTTSDMTTVSSDGSEGMVYPDEFNSAMTNIGKIVSNITSQLQSIQTAAKDIGIYNNSKASDAMTTTMGEMKESIVKAIQTLLDNINEQLGTGVASSYTDYFEQVTTNLNVLS